MFHSTRICLTPLHDEDAPLMFAWINDRELRRLNGPYRPVHPGEHRAWFDGVQRRSDLVIFGIRLREADRLIGTCQLHDIHSVHRSAELQIRIGDAENRGKGYGTEAARLLLDFAFGDLNLRRVQLHAFVDNTAALRCYEKVGFVREGLLRQAAYVDGRYVDVVTMGLLREGHADA